jgi:hypothetical protein
MTLSKQQKEQIENFVAGFFERSEDIQAVSESIATRIELRLMFRETRQREAQEMPNGPAN